jgi:hypothetical protein
MGHLFSVDLATAALRRVVGAAGTSVEPVWSPDGRRIAFKHSTVRHAPELWVVGRDGDDPQRPVASMPPQVEPDRFPLPRFTRTRGAAGWEIPGYLLAPRDLEPDRRYPALVYVHGGGMRQMREGFPPQETYAFRRARGTGVRGRRPRGRVPQDAAVRGPRARRRLGRQLRRLAHAGRAVPIPGDVRPGGRHRGHLGLRPVDGMGEDLLPARVRPLPRPRARTVGRAPGRLGRRVPAARRDVLGKVVAALARYLGPERPTPEPATLLLEGRAAPGSGLY